MKVYRKFIAIIFALLLTAVLTAAAQKRGGGEQIDKKNKPRGPVEMPMKQQLELHNKAAKLPAGPDFYIEAVAGAPVQYSILLTDNNNRSVPGTFIRPQIEVFAALLVAARQFALTEEEAGTAGQPKVTRFVDKNEPAFIVDVQKTNLTSQFFITIKSLFGTLTIDAGTLKRVVKRGDQKEPEPLFYKIITRVEEVKEAVPTIRQNQQ